MYVTKGKRLSVVRDDENGKTYYYLNSNWGRSLNQDIPFRFWFDEYDTLEYINIWDGSDYFGNNQSISWNVDSKYLNSLCLDYQDVLDYGFRENPKPHQKTLYAWHIKKLEIFSEPMELSKFYRRIDGLDEDGGYILASSNESVTIPQLRKRYLVQKAPQSFMYVYVEGEEG